MLEIGSGNSNALKSLVQFYNLRILPRINHIRGAHRLSRLLEEAALRRESEYHHVDSSEAEGICSKDWDNLIVLDACRHDLFESVRGQTECRITKGSNSPEFIRENFSKNSFQDTVLITANPHYSPVDVPKEDSFPSLTGKNPRSVFFECFMTFSNDKDWNDKKGTVEPENVVRDAITAHNLFPDKRKIVHFMQPHHPFLDVELDEPGFSDMFTSEENDTVWTKAMKGEVEHSEVVEGYRVNLDTVLEEVDHLIEELKGKTVITSDHGNFLGEAGLYGHRPGSSHAALRKVPWDVVEES